VSERFVATGAGDYSALESRFETTYDATIAPIAPIAYTAKIPVESSSPADGSPSLSERMALHTVLYTYYVSHELPILDRTVAYDGPLGPYYGAYQFYLAAAFVERVVPAWNIDAVMIPQLKAANVYGWFSTAWGGMYLDFGLVGALIAVLICGWLAGHVYRSALSARTDGGRLLMCYVLAGIIATPILSIFTISISLPILVSLVITAYALRPARLWPLRASIPSGAPAPAP
jgi:oligosaccharide repeat unit polymerase